jgi:hypothetical protein
MPTRGYNLRMPRHPLLQIVYALIGGIVLIGALFMGAVLIAIALGVGLIVGIAVLLRAWWLGRGRSRPSQGGPAERRQASGDLLETEYRVVAERDARDERDERAGRGH